MNLQNVLIIDLFAKGRFCAFKSCLSERHYLLCASMLAAIYSIKIKSAL